MSKRLSEMVNDRIEKLGKNGQTRLCADAGVSPSTLRNILKGDLPSAETTLALALACGMTEDEAKALAGEVCLEKAKEKAS